MRKKIARQPLKEGTLQLSRRKFLKVSGITTFGFSVMGIPAPKAQNISLIWDNNDEVASFGPAQWAIAELLNSLKSKGISIREMKQGSVLRDNALNVVIGGSNSLMVKQFLREAKASIPEVPEAVGLIPLLSNGKNILIVCGYDVRGLVYALLELSDRVNYGTEPSYSLIFPKPVIEKPANEIRSLNRLFVSEVEDKPWFYDRKMWPPYLTMLATQRYNRFNLSLGIGYDFLENVTDSYFVFAYPFFISVPGYNVHVPQLQDSERERNLGMLKFISEQTEARGMHFQLGLWMHGYEWQNSPNPNYTIAGVTRENHGPYCRDAIRTLLKACPAISGVTLRVHGESGVTEGSYDFWQLVFEGIATCGRKVEIDLHPKGIDQTMIDLVVGSGMPVVISPKYWAEHLGMPYQQSDIRELEVPKPGQQTTKLMNLSTGSRSFTRYGYGDLLKEGRPYKVIHRIWSGTRRILLWGDPMMAAAYSRAFSFCGSAGMDLMEPLSFKGRRGSGIEGDRCGYADKSLKPCWDWGKYLYTLRVWGRLQYNSDTDPDVWQRFLKKQFGLSFSLVEEALAVSSRILPVVLTAHGASAANNAYWPEMYFNQPIADPGIKHPYADSPSPKMFGNVSPFDPQMFVCINDFAKELLKGERNGKYTPLEVAQWIEDYADEAEKTLDNLLSKNTKDQSPEFKRLVIDVSIQTGLGRFFGAKFRAGVLYGIFEQSGERKALEEALITYRKARRHWESLANIAGDVYQHDITVGEQPYLRGHWLDRLSSMDEDITCMTKKLETVTQQGEITNSIQKAVSEALERPHRPKRISNHIPPSHFKRNQFLELVVSFEKLPESGRLFYRHVNHGERWQSIDMKFSGNLAASVIPASYTNSPYPLEYDFEFQEGPESAWLYPGFNENLDNQPYFVVRNI